MRLAEHKSAEEQHNARGNWGRLVRLSERGFQHFSQTYHDMLVHRAVNCEEAGCFKGQ